MKKKIVVALMLIILITGLFVPKVDAGYVNNVKYTLLEQTISIKGSGNKDFTANSDEILKTLQEDFDYTGNDITENMRFITTITIRKISNDSYNVKFGKSNKNIQNQTRKQLKNKYGITDEIELKDGKTEVPAVLIVKAKREEVKQQQAMSQQVTALKYTIVLDEIYTGNDKRKGEERAFDEGASLSYDHVADNWFNSLKDFIDGVVDFASEFKENPGQAIARVILNFFKAIFDSVQRIINNFQTITDGSGISFLDTKLRYSFEELKAEKVSDSDLGPNNKYTRVKKVDEGDETTYEKKWQTLITVDPEEHEFTKDKTAIPVIPIDIYNMAVGNVDIFSVDFLSTSGNSNSIWNFFRSVFSALTHLTIYVTAALLLTTLIYHGIHLVWFSINTTPTNRKEHQDGLQRFATALIMLIGVVVIMALAINASKIFLQPINDATGGTTDELSIRVHVTDTYEFSTNITGFARYMAQSTDFDTMANYTIIYIVLVIINVFTALMMLCRMFIMLFLGILGPIVVAAYALHKENSFPMNFSKWTTNYVKLALIQVFLAAVCNIIIESGMI